ncbi:MAG: 50S ribosomal protein L3 [Candidatus Nealsonbacteria bacterium]|nr:50S ribosomal protein L3 [Candidatus Nealsonbacteria bacterium]
MKFILGKKNSMTQVFLEGKSVPVTLVEVEPNEVTQVKNKKTDGYCAVQLGFDKIIKAQKIKKSQKGKEFRYLREFHISEADLGNYPVGSKIEADLFQPGDKVSVAGVSKGKGYQGAVKIWGFRGRLSATHGQKHELRTLGSVGSSEPDHVRKGRKMSGRLGAERISVKNVKIAQIDKENNLMAIRGALPGRPGTLLEIRGR